MARRPAASGDIFSFILLLAQMDAPAGGGRPLPDGLWVVHRRLLAFIRYRCADEDLAEDILSETYLAFLRAGKGADDFRDDTALRNYLMSIASNKLRDHFRRGEEKIGRRLRFRSIKELELWMDSLADRARGQEEEIAEAQEDERRRLLVASVMARLPDRYREILKLKFTDGMGNPEIAEKLALGVKAAESLLVRAKAAFRKEFLRQSLPRQGFPQTRGANGSAPDGVDGRKGYPG